MYGHNRYGSTRYGASEEDVLVLVKHVFGGITATASVERKIGKTIDGTIIATATIDNRDLARAVAGTIVLTTDVGRKTGKDIAAGITLTADANRKSGKGISGELALSGTVGRDLARSVAGGITLTGTIENPFVKAIVAGITLTATAGRKIGKTIAGGITLDSAIGRKIGKTIAGGVTLTGTVNRGISRAIAAGITLTATVVRKAKAIYAGGVELTAEVNRLIKKTISAGMTMTGAVGRDYARTVSGGVTLAGSVNRGLARGVAAGISLGATVVRKIATAYEGGIELTGTVGRLIKKQITAGLTLTAKAARNVYDMAYEMNKPIRKILGRVAITYTDPFFSAGIEASASETGRFTYPDQTTDNVQTEAYKWFSLHQNLLDGTFHLLPSNREYSVGWWSATLSHATTAIFSSPPVLTIEHSARSVESLLVVGDDKLEEYPVDFWVRLYSEGDVLEYAFHEEANAAVEWTKDLSPTEVGIVKHELTIVKWSRVSSVAKIAQFFTMLEETYDSEDGELFSIRVLEEREYEEPTIPQGNISSNEITVRLNNIDDLFSAGNFNSRLYGMLLNNRAIRAWLGCDLKSGIRKWFPLGTFYSRDWSTPEDVAWAEVRGLDMLDRLKRTEFSTSEVYTNVTLHDLAITVMADAGLTDADWDIDPTLDTADYTIPYAWFDRMSHREALRRIAAAALGQVYCNRDGKIVVEIYTAPAAMACDFHFDESNFFTIDHPLEWSQMVNYVQARADPRVASAEQEICVDTETFTVPGSGTVTKTHYFDLSPCVDVVDPPVIVNDINGAGHVTVDSMTAYAWGALVTYSNSDPDDETVTSVTIRGKPLEVQGGRVVVAQDASSIASNGKQALSEPISSEFWQNETQAQAAADSLLAVYKDPRHDVIMRARGNIALLLGDRVVAPDYADQITMEYGLMRQDVNFNGGLEVAVTAQRIPDGMLTYRKHIAGGITLEGRPLWDSGLTGGYGSSRYGEVRYGAAEEDD